jgi:hypothetical protein
MRLIIFPRKNLINARAYRLLLKAVYDEALAQLYSDGLNYGVLGGVLPNREYLILPGVTGPFIPPLFPGDFPDAGSGAQKVYLHALSLYEAYTRGMANVRLFLVAAIDEDMMATLDEHQLGFRFSVIEILAALHARFNLMSPVDLLATRAALGNKYTPGTDMRTFVNPRTVLLIFRSKCLARAFCPQFRFRLKERF